MEILYTVIIPLIIGYVLDFMFGDPYGLPHPVRLFGNMISWIERKWNYGGKRFAKGCVVAVVYPLSVWAFGIFLSELALSVNIWLYVVLATIFVYYGLANRCLIFEGGEVIRTLEQEGLEAGRERLSWIVGRDTSSLSEKEIYTAVFETMSENLSDGVVAPLFYYACGGFPAMMAYKMVNTLDSMIGYKDERYARFGCCAARLDDVLNYIPARLTALLMAVVAYKTGIFTFIHRNCHRHASPNSGYPESAMAGLLGCRFGGPHVYHGLLIEKPYIGTCDRELNQADFLFAVKVNHRVTFVSVALICVLLLVVHILLY